ncbi:hypothetical protein IPJ72_07075 [Candidatus Peregrinibacteria bacterium]|nr:MAG: hypothetical protein IPJ72_07075 [Candidatus Peregrinibacteria bacterium]
MALGFLLLALPDVGHAFFSPYIANQSNAIQQNVQLSKRTHGVGSFLNAFEKLTEANASTPNVTGTLESTGDFTLFYRSVKTVLNDSLTNALLDDWALLLGADPQAGTTLSNCLKQDIWSLKALREQVTNELFKAALLNDHASSTALWKDFETLNTLMGFLRSDQAVMGYKDTDLLFPGIGKNYYLDCPYSTFSQAFVQLKNSIERLKNLGNSVDFSVAGIRSAAEKRAYKRAAQWIEANRITLRLSGKDGPNGRSLVQGPGGQQLVGELKSSLALANDAVNGLQPNWNPRASSFKNLADAYVELDDARDVLRTQIEAGLIMNLSLNNVGEQDLYAIDDALTGINTQINRATTPSGTVNHTLLTLCNELSFIQQNQCTNKRHAIISCGN